MFKEFAIIIKDISRETVDASRLTSAFFFNKELSLASQMSPFFLANHINTKPEAGLPAWRLSGDFTDPLGGRNCQKQLETTLDFFPGF